MVTLGQVAEVTAGAADKPGDATVNGRPGVVLIVHKQPYFNTLGVTEAVQQALEELKPALPKGAQMHPQLFRQASFIQRAIGNLNVAILWGCGLVTLILIAFLFQWRTVVISLLAIPLSHLGGQFLPDFREANFQVKQFLRERIDKVLTGTTADVVIRIVGPDLGVLRSQAEAVRAAIQKRPRRGRRGRRRCVQRDQPRGRKPAALGHLQRGGSGRGERGRGR